MSASKFCATCPWSMTDADRAELEELKDRVIVLETVVAMWEEQRNAGD